jgi:hypothetical protein
VTRKKEKTMVNRLNLMTHAGANRVDRDALQRVETPVPTETWMPIPHFALLGGVQAQIEGQGLHVVEEAHALARDGNRYFGLLQLQNGNNPADYSLVVGLRNSHDKSFPAGLCCGSGVFVCDNLAFSGEITLARKHTRYIMDDLANLISRAVGGLGDLRRSQDARIAAYKTTGIADAQAHDLIVRALDADVVPVTRVPKVLAEWRNPSHPEFAEGRNAWRLFNAFTEVMKGSGIFERPRTSLALHGIMDAACGLAVVGRDN